GLLATAPGGRPLLAALGGGALLALAQAVIEQRTVKGTQFTRLVHGRAGPGPLRPGFRTVLVDRTDGGAALDGDRFQGQGLRRITQADAVAQFTHLVGVEGAAVAAAQVAGQLDDAVTDALEAADGQAHGLPQAAHLAVATLAQQHAVPRMAFVTMDLDDVVEGRWAVFQFDSGAKLLQVLVPDLAKDPADVFTLHTVAGMHERVGQLAVRGEQQQAGGVDVQASHAHPARALEARQLLEHGGTTFRILVRGHQPFRLVVDQHPGFLWRAGHGDEAAAVDFHAVAVVDLCADLRHFAVDADFSGGDAFLDAAAGAQARVGQHLVQAFGDLGHAGGVA